jgi:glycosidase
MIAARRRIGKRARQWLRPAGGWWLGGMALLLFSCAARTVRTPSAGPSAAPAPPPWQHDWVRGAVFYEVFVRSFADSNGDGIGDLKGLRAKLDYLNDGDPATAEDLGIDALWLMPVFQSPSYHGYDTTDYEHIDSDYGADRDFNRLCRAAHRRGIRVIVDLVINHTSSAHPWFIDSASGPSAARRDWYIWSPTDPGWTQPWGGNNPTWHFKNGAYYYGLFWSGMPDLNFRTPEVRAEMERLALYWLEQGADGFRLDAARHLIETGGGAGQLDSAETHEYWKEFAARVRGFRPQAVLVGENWTDTPTIATYFGSTAEVAGGDELPVNFDFPLAEAILQGIRSGGASAIAAKLAEIQALYPPGVIDAPFLTNHDQVRLATQLGGRAEHLRSAAAILLTLPGAPFLYYGEEVGLENGPTPGDESKRTPMPWDASAGGGFSSAAPWFAFAPGREVANVAAQNQDPGSLLSHYRNLIRTRHRSAALRTGSLELLTEATGNAAVLAFRRVSESERVLVAHNLSDSFSVAGPYLLQSSALEPLFQDSGAAAVSAGTGSWRLTLPPHASGIWRLR